MTIEACYAKLGGSYARVCRRLPGRHLIDRFLRRYLEDDSAQMLFASLESGDMEEAYRYALSLKGVAANLGFEDLEKAVTVLAENIRFCGGGITEHLRVQMEVVRIRQTQAVETISEYLKSI